MMYHKETHTLKISKDVVILNLDFDMINESSAVHLLLGCFRGCLIYIQAAPH